MTGSKRWWRRDVPLRIAGLFAIVAGILAIRQLISSFHVLPRHEATLAELCLAAIGFLGCSFGGALTFLGAHIHDEVEIAERWKQRPPDRQTADRLGETQVMSHLDSEISVRPSYCNRPSDLWRQI